MMFYLLGSETMMTDMQTGQQTTLAGAIHDIIVNPRMDRFAYTVSQSPIDLYLASLDGTINTKTAHDIHPNVVWNQDGSILAYIHSDAQDIKLALTDSAGNLIREFNTGHDLSPPYLYWHFQSWSKCHD